MSNSSLVTYKAMTSHYGYSKSGAPEHGRYGHKIDKIFVHHMAGNLTVQQCGNVFKTRTASAHYGINGKNIGQYVDEGDCAWHCGNKEYNIRSIGIECANDGGASSNWHVSDTTIQTLIKLLADICKRNGIKKLNFTGSLSGNLCLHCYTQATACPGGYLKGKMKYIADQTNKLLTAAPAPAPAPAPTPAPAPAKKTLYRVRKSWSDPKSQIGAFENLENAKSLADKFPGYSVYGENGKRVYPATIEVIFRVRKTWADEKSQKGAFKSIENAKKECDKYAGYHVYDYAGKVVYTSKKKYSVAERILATCKEQSVWMKDYTYDWKKWNPRNIATSKKYGTCVTYVACVLQRLGVLKAGEYIWHTGSGYGTGKVYGADKKNLEVTYLKNKTFTQCKDKIEAGDILMVDDNKSGKSGDGGHIFIFAGTWTADGKPYIWDNNTAKKGQKPMAYAKSHKLLARVRVKSL